MKLVEYVLPLLVLISPCVAAAEDGWSGEGSFSAGSTSGNTDTTDLGLGLDLNRKMGPWNVGLDAAADFGEIDGVESKNRWFFAGNIDRDISERLFAFGQTSYEKDEFSGFDTRIFVGAGLGYHIYKNEGLNWTVKAAPGIKIDEVKEVVTAGVVTTPGETVESFSVLGNSDFSYVFNENVSLTNVTAVIYAEESTQLNNSIGITATLTNTLSARASFDVRHDTNPPVGFEDTDTATRLSLVYRFGS